VDKKMETRVQGEKKGIAGIEAQEEEGQFDPTGINVVIL
jgi:hypothetical protein